MPAEAAREWITSLEGIRADMTLLELDVGHGFIEKSPMRSMKLWRHERVFVHRHRVVRAKLRGKSPGSGSLTRM